MFDLFTPKSTPWALNPKPTTLHMPRANVDVVVVRFIQGISGLLPLRSAGFKIQDLGALRLLLKTKSLVTLGFIGLCQRFRLTVGEIRLGNAMMLVAVF